MALVIKLLRRLPVMAKLHSHLRPYSPSAPIFKILIVSIGTPNNGKGGYNVNKSEIIDQIARSADISKAAAGRALDSTVTAIKTAMKKGGMVTLVGFGTFYVGKRAARNGRNPRTGASIKIKAARVPKFRAGKALKDALN
jgi:DNA-binding protein HU-beta